MERVASFIGRIGMYVALATFTAMTLNLVAQRLLQNQPVLTLGVMKGLVNAVIVAITIVVVAVPEGLPLAVTISLAYSVNQMRKENNLVRRLEAAETMGGANEILTDKTGTLTENRMTVLQLYAEGSLHQTLQKVSLPTQDLILTACSVNSNSYILFDEKTKVLKRIGNQTECALLDFVNGSLTDLERPEKNYEQIKAKHKILKTFPFNSETKKMTVVIELEPSKKVRIFTKGASENIIEDCTTTLDANGGQLSFNDVQKQHIRDVIIKNMAQNALRTISVGYKDITFHEYKRIQVQLERAGSAFFSNGGSEESKNGEESQDEGSDLVIDKDLTLIGIFGIRDVLRPGIRDAVLKCTQASVNVRMVTGDNRDTAVAIAKEIGILPQDEDAEGGASRFRCMTGVEFRKHFGGLREEIEGCERKEVVNDLHAFREIVKELKVLARSTPMDKYILTTGLK